MQGLQQNPQITGYSLLDYTLDSENGNCFLHVYLRKKKNIHYNPPEEIQLHISRVRFKAIVRLDKK